MTKIDRAILIILDGVGVGALPDASAYGPPDADARANCLGNVARAVGGLGLPTLEMLGLGNITDIMGTPPTTSLGAFGRMAESSVAKDSTTGHWEIAGLITTVAPPTYPHGFPPEMIARFEAAIGRATLGNRAASGTAIIEELGAESVRTGCPIVYTSADSVFQIAAHESVTPIEELYRWCAIARAQLTPPHAVGRVIARPFMGEPGNFIRTPRRRDFSLPPFAPTLLDVLRDGGYDVIGVGKIGDLFTERGLSSSEHPGTDVETMAQTLHWLGESWSGLLFVNLVECDQLWGHRRDPRGYADALQNIDAWLPTVIDQLGPRDAVFIAGDHGTDPTVGGTDHTREYVPVLAVGPSIKGNVDLGTRPTFADLGATIVAALGVTQPLMAGTSFWQAITE